MASRPDFDRFRSGARKTVRVTREELVRTRFLNDREVPLVIEPSLGSVNLASWLAANREAVERHLLRHAAVLFRGFGIDSGEAFHEAVRALGSDLLDYQERAAPRIEVSKGVYTSTEFPADQSIPLHHEMSYAHNWPERIWFYCHQPSETGGRTPIAPDRDVIGRLDPVIKERFLERKVMYVRNYGEGVDLSWQEAFQTDSREKVEEYCRGAGMEVEWRGGDRLRTRAVRQVVATHPRTGETVWFNHAHMFHVSNLPETVRSALLSQFAEEELPRNAFYGDGEPIEAETLESIREVYRSAAVAFPWQHGDVLLVDNFLASHGREPYTGARRILVAMTDLYINREL